MKHIVVLTIVLSSLLVYADEKFLKENFNSLNMWEPLTFPKIKNHSKYSIVRDKNNGILLAESNASASGIILKQKFDVYSYPVVKWRWKIDNVYRKGDASRKSGDDYPIRVYIVFKYDPEKSSFSERAKYGAAKLVYGEYPPHSSINYIWSSIDHGTGVITSPYTDKAKMIALRHGTAQAGTWVDEEIDIIKDYRKAFGEDPPSIGSIAIMNDSDNTGESSKSYIDYIEISGK